ncbi:hypothetical protein ACFL6U_03690 [Planctomycetota bacterium]
MAMKGALRHELGKYRKGRPGSMPGLPYSGYGGRKHYVSAPVSHTHTTQPRDLYNLPGPQEYHPNLFAPAVQSNEYITDLDGESPRKDPPHQPKLFRPYPNIPFEEDSFDYENSQIMSEFFMKVQEVQYRSFEDGEEIPSTADIWQEHFAVDDPIASGVDLSNSEMIVEPAEEQTPDDLARQFMNITDALSHLQTVFPADHPDIVNLKTAFHGMLDDPIAMSKLESLAGDTGPSKLGIGDPYAIDSIEEAGQLYDQQLEMIERQFENPQLFMQAVDHEYGSSGDVIPGVYDSLESNVLSFERMAYEEDLGPAGPLDTPGPESLEQVIEGHFEQAMEGHSSDSAEIPFTNSNPLAPESFSPEMDGLHQEDMTQAYGESTPLDAMHPIPDPYLTAQDIFDEQMEFMANPLAMPGAFGPMGPMPGPMPGM